MPQQEFEKDCGAGVRLDPGWYAVVFGADPAAGAGRATALRGQTVVAASPHAFNVARGTDSVALRDDIYLRVTLVCL